MKHELARRKALADACAGVVGSLVSMLVFYPVDVWKTNLQAGKKTPSDDSMHANDAIIKTNDGASILQRIQTISRLFRGLSYKIAHTTVSSFTYFFVYSLVQTKYFAYHKSLNNNTANERISAITKLSLAAFAAVINTGITLPLDTLSSRMQTGHHEDMDEDKTEVNGDGNHMDEESNAAQHINEKGRDNHNSTATDSRSKSQLYISSPEKFKFSFSTNLRDEAFISSESITTQEYNTKLRQRLQSILSLWNGLLPAILLCSNPAIQYTMYDTLKSWLLQHRPKRQQQHDVQKSLSMKESFICGLVSKFVATIATYPLIRAKVMMMVAPTTKKTARKSSLESTAGDDSTTNCTEKENASNHRIDLEADQKHPNSLLLLLLHISRKDGVRGLYRGCSLQLLHTVLKSALLLMVREKITFATRHFFQVEDGG